MKRGFPAPLVAVAVLIGIWYGLGLAPPAVADCVQTHANVVAATVAADPDTNPGRVADFAVLDADLRASEKLFFGAIPAPVAIFDANAAATGPPRTDVAPVTYNLKDSLSASSRPSPEVAPENHYSLPLRR